MPNIAPTAVVDKSAKLGDGVVIGPGCVIGPDVAMGSGCELRANVFIAGRVRLGNDNRLFANVVLGEEPQMTSREQPDTEVIIGDNNVFRENVTVNRGSAAGVGKTVIGNNNYLMIGAHLGHDCHIQDNVAIGNYCQIGGHNLIESNAWLNAFSGTHQFVTVGRFCYAGGLSGVTHDLPPFVRVSGSYPCEVRGLNTIGLTRAGVAPESIDALQQAYRSLYRRRQGRSLAAIVAELLAQDDLDENVEYLLTSLQRSSQHRYNRYRELSRSDPVHT